MRGSREAPGSMSDCSAPACRSFESTSSLDRSIGRDRLSHRTERRRRSLVAPPPRPARPNLQKLGVKLEVTEAVLNHVSGSRAGIVGVYQRHEYAAEKRAALDAWARRLEAIVRGESESNVVELAKARG